MARLYPSCAGRCGHSQNRGEQMKLTYTQEHALRWVAAGEPFRGCHGQSEHGGRVSTLWSLKRRGLVAIAGGWVITREGENWLAEHPNAA